MTWQSWCVKSNLRIFFQVNSFPEDLVYASGIEDCITVMRSAVMPKKITFRGSNGKKYSFLCKPKDDLRRDCRLLDFNNLLNKLFLKDPESRKRNLHLRTYVSYLSFLCVWKKEKSPKIIKGFFWGLIFFFGKFLHGPILHIFSGKANWNHRTTIKGISVKTIMTFIRMKYKNISIFAIFRVCFPWMKQMVSLNGLII